MDQLRQRVIASYHLGPISAQETREYIRHRLSAVGWNNDPVLSEDAYTEIYQKTGGVPRKINILCSRLLLFGFLEERHELDGAAVTQVADDLKQETEQVLEIEETPAPQVAVAPAPQVAVVPAPQEAASVPQERMSAEPAASPPAVQAPEPSAPEPEPSAMEAPPSSGAPEQVEDSPAEGASASEAAVLADAERELTALRHRLETAESQMQRHERMLRWTQLMLKHHERLLRRRAHKAVSNG
jgi:hypothetical protein